MFKNLLQLWRGKNFLSEVLGEFNYMLINARGMFVASVERVVENKDKPGLKDEIYAIDRKINDSQKEIRKRVIEHLSLQPSVDTAACLLLMSVVKDGERLGDYAKNIFEISILLDKPVDKDTYNELFDDVDKEILDLFDSTKEAFIASNEEKAKNAWERQRIIRNRCDEIIDSLTSSTLSSNEIVCFTMLSRFYRRIAAHLTNIATSVIVPLSDLDYYDERNLDD